MKRILFSVLVLAVSMIFSGNCEAQIESAGAVVLVNSASPNNFDFDRYLKLYLDYFDVPYLTIDVAKQPVPFDLDKSALVILGHEGVLAGIKPDDIALIEEYIKKGGGVFSFDMGTTAEKNKQLLPNILKFEQTEPNVIEPNSVIKFVDKTHYITTYKVDRPDLRTVEPAFRAGWPGYVKMPKVTAVSKDAKTLVTLADFPLVVIMGYGKGKIVQWTTYNWLDANILGFYNGLDDIVWRSVVWAARKPFVFQGNLPLVSMRMDDCYGPWDNFQYVEVINKYGIIPHISFFMDAMSPSAATKLGEYSRAGKLETFIHSREVGEGKFFYSDFDIHDRPPGKEAPDSVIKKNFADLDAFIKKYDIKYAKSAVTHWTAPGRNTLPYLRKMGIQYSSFLNATPSCGETHPWPYELYQGAGHFEKTFGTTGSGNFVYHPGFTLDWMKDEPSIFCVESGCPSIKADWLRPSAAPGYEGTRKVAGMIIDGTNMLRHHLDSMGPAYFFTHELNIGMLEDRNDGLDKAFAGVFENIRKFHNVIPCGWDYFNQYNKNVRTITFEAAYYDAAQKKLSVHCNGFSDIATKFHIFTEKDGKIADTLYDVPVYRGPTVVTVEVK